MFGFCTLLLPCLLAVLPTYHGRPLQLEKMKQLIQIASARIQLQMNEDPISDKITFKFPDEVPGNQPIQGLGSAVETLAGLQRMVDSLRGPNSQFSVDLSSLRGYLNREMTSLQCPARKPSSFKELDAFLKNNQTFSLTMGPAVMQRVKDYLNKLLPSLETLKTC